MWNLGARRSCSFPMAATGIQEICGIDLLVPSRHPSRPSIVDRRGEIVKFMRRDLVDDAFVFQSGEGFLLCSLYGTTSCFTAGTDIVCSFDVLCERMECTIGSYISR